MEIIVLNQSLEFLMACGYLTILLHEWALDMRWQIANKVRSAKLAIIISYPTTASGKCPQNIENSS